MFDDPPHRPCVDTSLRRTVGQKHLEALHRVRHEMAGGPVPGHHPGRAHVQQRRHGGEAGPAAPASFPTPDPRTPRLEQQQFLHEHFGGHMGRMWLKEGVRPMCDLSDTYWRCF